MKAQTAMTSFAPRLTTTLRLIAAWISTWVRGSKDEHEYEFSSGQKLFITTDLGRLGVVRGRRYDELTNTEFYLIERECGAREWYPRMSLCLSKEQIGGQPTSREIPLSAEDAAQFMAKGHQ